MLYSILYYSNLVYYLLIIVHKLFIKKIPSKYYYYLCLKKIKDVGFVSFNKCVLDRQYYL